MNIKLHNHLHGITAVIVALLLGSLANAAEVSSETKPFVLPGCVQFDLPSEEGRIYRIFVRGPSGPVPEGGSPVIYLTDGNQGIVTMVAAASRQRALAGATIVGIGYPDAERQQVIQWRSRDLLFEVDPNWWPAIPAEHRTYLGSDSGGADQFLNFIQNTLKPEIEKRYQINRQQQLLFGHSLGGLFVLYAMSRQPDAFQYYCAASPSIWVDNRSVLKRIPDFKSRMKTVSHPVHLQVTVGEEENPGFGGPPDREEMLKARRQVDNARELASMLDGKVPGLTVECEVFPHEDHGTSLLAACNRAARLLSESTKAGPSDR